MGLHRMPFPSAVRAGRWWGGVLIAAVLLWPSASRAAVDVSGAWLMTFQLFPVSFPMVMTQVGTTLSATIGIGIGSSTPAGTIDPDTGVFTLTGSYLLRPGIPEAPPEVTCHYVLAATASADGQTFSGTHDDDCGLHTAATGVRQTCGNGVVDLGEACDAAMPCCTATCQLAPAGTPCPDDANPCTDDLCSASGACEHPDNAAACSASGCTADTCMAGACVPGGPLLAGTSCPDDGNPCTADTCDGAGGCRHPAVPAGTFCADDAASCTLHICDAAGQCVGVPRQCPPCETCFLGQCLAIPTTLCASASVGSLLDLRVSAPGKQRLQWTFEGAAPTFPLPGDFGDPRTSAQYSLCLYLVSTAGSIAMGATLPPGGSCGSGPCWSALEKGFAYQNQGDVAGTGIQGMRLVNRPGGRHRIRVSGRGPNLDLPATLGLSSALVQLVKEGGVFPVCWQADFTTPLASTPGHFRARR